MRIGSEVIRDILGGATDLIDQLYTTDEERLEARLRLVELAHQSDLAQLEVNAQEAAHTSMFVSGWRPAMGWICVSAFAMTFLLFPMMEMLAAYYYTFTGQLVNLNHLPDLDLATMMPVLMGMLGLGGMRSWEKSKGVARS